MKNFENIKILSYHGNLQTGELSIRGGKYTYEIEPSGGGTYGW